MVGVVLSIRQKEDVLSVWIRDNQNSTARLRIGYGGVHGPRRALTALPSTREKFKEILELSGDTPLEYKIHNVSMKDKSSFRNAKPYYFNAK